MLLHRFEVQVVPNQSPRTPRNSTMSVMVSFYRKNVDPMYQNLICQKISTGELDDYVSMMIISLVNNGTS